MYDMTFHYLTCANPPQHDTLTLHEIKGCYVNDLKYHELSRNEMLSYPSCKWSEMFDL